MVNVSDTVMSTPVVVAKAPAVGAPVSPDVPASNPRVYSQPGEYQFNYPAGTVKLNVAAVGGGSSGYGSASTSTAGNGGAGGGFCKFTMPSASKLADGAIRIVIPPAAAPVTGSTAENAGGTVVITNRAGDALAKAGGAAFSAAPGAGNITAATTAVSATGISLGSSGQAAAGKTGGNGGKAAGGGIFTSVGGVGGGDGVNGTAGKYGGGGGSAGAKISVSTSSGGGGPGAVSIGWE